MAHLPQSSAVKATKAAGGGLLATIVIGGIIGAFTGSVGYTAYDAHATSYLSNDPKACINCHVMNEQYDGWSSSSHHSRATCNDCHLPHDSLVNKLLVKSENGYRHSLRFTLQDFHEPIQITPADRQVVIDNCVRCHESMTHEIRRAAPGHGAEAESISGGVDCIHCHASVAHGPTR